jgi:mxaD protein
MKLIFATAIAISMLAAGVGMAAAPQLHVRKTITIDAPAAKVWHLAKDFDGLNTWHPAVAKDEIVAGANDKAGAVRLLTLKDGGTIKEKLLGFDSPARTFRYEILESVLPVSDYKSTFVVKSIGKNKAAATWSGWFKRKNVGDNPADNENDKTAVDAIGGVYQSGLDNLKKLAEAQ